MGCACNKNKKQWQVVADGGSGRVLFTSTSEATAKAVSKRYENSKVQEKPKEEPATAEQA
ncbi:hypothetical protein [Streptomyces sp. A1136]|uniref:hypothetical protein n=1 Tax=Streptomyces sp. A1136 TaxID=2563102 RepID=UPI00109EA85E|nr:hypothetical protein [Streptomyces sp. A1136]THA54236.1 hypothetical protein E6R62_16860 [Streptomyces sp. A1136]